MAFRVNAEASIQRYRTCYLKRSADLAIVEDEDEYSAGRVAQVELLGVGCIVACYLVRVACLILSLEEFVICRQENVATCGKIASVRYRSPIGLIGSQQMGCRAIRDWRGNRSPVALVSHYQRIGRGNDIEKVYQASAAINADGVAGDHYVYAALDNRAVGASSRVQSIIRDLQVFNG